VIESKALTGDDLALADVWGVAVQHDRVSLADTARERMRAAREVVENAAHGTREHTYGVNTGFGKFVSRAIPEELTEELQLRLLRNPGDAQSRLTPDLAFVGRRYGCKHSEQATLAGTVTADQRDFLARVQVECDVVEQRHMAVR
jgi:hypothetical protein